MQDLNLTGEVLRLFNESTPDVQAEFLRLQANKAKARELADMVGSVVVDENIPLSSDDTEIIQGHVQFPE